MLEEPRTDPNDTMSDEEHNTDNPSTKDPEKLSVFEHIKEIFKIALLVVLIVFPIRAFVAQPFIVSGDSMYPTFKNGEYLIVDQVGYRFQEPERGEVIVFRFTEGQKQFFIKRVIGLPGETVEVRNGHIYITSPGSSRFELQEPYVEHFSSDSLSTTLGENEYFVMGDNRMVSLDSRRQGPVDRDLIIGRAFLRLLPIRAAGVWPGGHTGQYEISTQGGVPLAVLYIK